MKSKLDCKKIDFAEKRISTFVGITTEKRSVWIIEKDEKTDYNRCAEAARV